MPRVPNFLSASVLFERPRASSARVTKCLSSAWVPKYPLSVFWVPNFLLRALCEKPLCSITWNGLVNIFIEFSKFFQNVFYVTPIASSFLGNNMRKFPVLLAWCNYSRRFQNILQSYRKLIMTETRALSLVKLPYYSFSVQFYYCIRRITGSSLIFQLIIFYRLTHASCKWKRPEPS